MNHDLKVPRGMTWGWYVESTESTLWNTVGQRTGAGGHAECWTLIPLFWDLVLWYYDHFCHKEYWEYREQVMRRRLVIWSLWAVWSPVSFKTCALVRGWQLKPLWCGETLRVYLSYVQGPREPFYEINDYISVSQVKCQICSFLIC